MTQCQLSVDWSRTSPEYPIVVDPEWIQVDQDGGSLCEGRQDHSATLIGTQDDFAGQVLIVGGLDSAGRPSAAVERFDPNSLTVQPCASLATPRVYHTATWVELPIDDAGGKKGMLLVVGGYGPGDCDGGSCDSIGAPLNTYELYDPSVDCDSPNCSGGACACATGHDSLFQLPDSPISLPRAEHTATALPGQGGNVLVAGGTAGADGAGAPALLFDTNRAFDSANPDASWSMTGSSFPTMFGHAAVYVPAPGADTTQDIVFLAGGSAQPLSGDQGNSALATDLLFKPSGGLLEMLVPNADAGTGEVRPAHSVTANLLDDAGVLLWGGDDSTLPAVVSFGKYFSKTGNAEWTGASASAASWAKDSVSADTSSIPALHGALLVGGIARNVCGPSGGSPYLGPNGWSSAVMPLNVPRVHHTVTPVFGGVSLVAVGGVTAADGGPCQFEPLSSIEVLAVGGLGEPCDAGASCVTGSCTDGVCCENACAHGPGSDTECQFCNSDGLCVKRPPGTACGQELICGLQASCDGTHLGCPTLDAGACDRDAGPEGSRGAAVDAEPDAPVDAEPDAPPVDAEADVAVVPKPTPQDSESFLSCSVSRPSERATPLGMGYAILGVGTALFFRRGGRGRARGKS